MWLGRQVGLAPRLVNFIVVKYPLYRLIHTSRCRCVKARHGIVGRCRPFRTYNKIPKKYVSGEQKEEHMSLRAFEARKIALLEIPNSERGRNNGGYD
ncbi:unnamed protein product [Sphenostylis stenocarpa]|uniref:Uncharacterized protein n=1 Tax=Sphenostylis stenocarpa TaxID=92480 RepID=A0AA86TJL0_9FABA|nr:unnamed protein product [Sphenostylis stenocarpa]